MVDTASITGNIADLLGDAYAPDLIRLVVESSVPLTEGTVTGGVRHNAPIRVDVEPDGDVLIADLPMTVNGSPLYRLTFEGRHQSGESLRVVAGWFVLEQQRSLAWIAANTVVPTMVTPTLVADVSAMAADVETRHADVMGVVATNDGIMASAVNDAGSLSTAAIRSRVSGDMPNRASVIGRALADSFIAGKNLGGLLPTSLTGVTIENLHTGAVKVVNHFDGVTYGYGTGNIYSSTNSGTSWTLLCAMPVSGALVGLMPTSDGEVIAVLAEGVWRSSGWGTGNVTWGTQKITYNGLAAPQQFCSDGYGLKFIVSEYGPGAGQAWTDSRYAWITLDGGVSWTRAWDSDVQTGNASVDSHVHGVCYSRWTDTFYVSEGHGPGAGIYHSTDNGSTWNLAPGMAPANVGMSASPTTIVATPEGLVISSDSLTRQGMWGALDTVNTMERRMVQTWEWRPARSGNNGWGQFGFYDENTGLVYIAWKSQGANVAPIITAGTPAAAGLVWEWPEDANPFTVNDFLMCAVVGDDGRLVAFGDKNGVKQQVRGQVGLPVASSRLDRGGILGGVADDATSTSVGVKSTTTGFVRATALGVSASASQDGVAVGHGAIVSAASGTAVGAGASSEATSVAFGQAAVTTGGTGIAVGAAASATGGNATAIGRSAAATVHNTAIGQGATATTGSSSVALGRQSTTTASNQVAIGGRHVELTEMTAPGNGAADTGRLYVKDNGAGKTVLCVKFSSGVEQVIATQP